MPLLWEPSFCNVSPVALGYTRGHFSALVPMETPQPEQSAKEENIQVCYLPLIDKDRKLLPIHFLTKAEVSIIIILSLIYYSNNRGCYMYRYTAIHS